MSTRCPDAECECSDAVNARIAELEAALKQAREALEKARETLICSNDIDGEPFQYGHWCPHCDEFVDRNMETRLLVAGTISAIYSALAGTGGNHV